MFVSLGNACVDRIRTGEWQRPDKSSLWKGLAAIAEGTLIGIVIHAGLSSNLSSDISLYLAEGAGLIEVATGVSLIVSTWLYPSEKKELESSQERQSQNQRNYAMKNRNSLLALARGLDNQAKDNALVLLKLIYTEAQLQKMLDLPPAYSS